VQFPDCYLNSRSWVAHIKWIASLYWIGVTILISLTSITNEWPRGVADHSPSAPEEIDLVSTGSDISAELASILKPR